MPFKTIVNERTHMAVESESGRCLGAVGTNFYRNWVFPLYTPSGLTVVREFPYDHPFHNGCFVGQHPIKVGGREANYWAAPPRRSDTDAIFVNVGRMDSPKEPECRERGNGVRYVYKGVWRDESGEPVIDEVRTVDLFAAPDATICDMHSEKIAAYGPAKFPKTKYGAIGIRVEPRLLPAFGSVVLGDSGREGTADVVHEQESDYVAYQNQLPDGRTFGVCMHILNAETRGPWFIRDYGMALFNPTWTQSIEVPRDESWTLSLRIIAYDGKLTDERAQAWIRLK